MKRVVISLLATLATAQVSLGGGNVTDYLLKGEQAISAFQDFNFALQFNLYKTGGAQATIQAMKKLRSSIGYFAATGCAASYTDLLDPTAFYDKLEYLNQNFQWARVAYGSKYLAALSQEQVKCQDELTNAFNTVEQTFQALYNFTYAKKNDPGSVDDKKHAFINACAHNDASTNALNVLIEAINGQDLDKDQFGCDLSEMIYRGSPSTQFYRGHRDLSLMMVAGIYNYALVGLLVESAFVTLNKFDASAWLAVQDSYEQRILQTYDRFFSLDSYIQSSQTQNAQYNIRALLASQPKSGVYTNQQVLDKVSGHLRDVFPSRLWYVVVYNGESTSHFSSHYCGPQNCIQATQVLDRYNIFAVGFDTATQAPNTKLLVSQCWRNLLNSMPMSDAYTQTYSLSGSYCFAAVLSLVGEHGAVYSLPNSQYYQLLRLHSGSDTVLTFASTKDQCLGSQVSMIEEDIEFFA